MCTFSCFPVVIMFGIVVLLNYVIFFQSDVTFQRLIGKYFPTFSDVYISFSVQVELWCKNM